MKAWQNRSIDYIKCEYLPDKKIPIVMETCSSEGKLMKQFGNPLILRGPPPPPFQLTLYFWAIFSWPPSLSEFQKQEPPP